MLKPRQRLERRISQGNSYPFVSPRLVTYIGDGCRWRMLVTVVGGDVDDAMFGAQNSMTIYLRTLFEILFDVVWDHHLSPTFKNCHHHKNFCNWPHRYVVLAPIRLPPLGPARLITRRESLNPLLLRRRASRRESLGKDKNHFYVLIEWYPYILTKIVIMDSLPPPDSNKIQFFIVGSSILRRTKVSRLYTVLYCRRDSFKRLSKP